MSLRQSDKEIELAESWIPRGHMHEDTDGGQCPFRLRSNDFSFQFNYDDCYDYPQTYSCNWIAHEATEQLNYYYGDRACAR